jgi:putrescine transport system ATP-binding protein
MTLSTRMAVMDAGRFQQIGSPTEIYEFPESRFVADFIGSANIFEGRVIEDGSDHVRVDTEIGEVFIDHGHSVKVGSKIWVALRPEKIRLEKTDEPSSGPNQVSGVVDDIGYLGETSIYKIRLHNDQIFDVTAPNQTRPMNRTHRITWEDRVNISWDASSNMLLNS